MSALVVPAPTSARQLSKPTLWLTAGVSAFVAFGVFGVLMAAGISEGFNIVAAVFASAILFVLLSYVMSRIVEGRRKAADRLATGLVTTAFIVALLPLISLIWTALVNGLPRFDALFFSSSMRNVVGEGGGGLHAIIGTLEITLAATIISVPIGIMTAIYLVEYGKGRLAKAITFFVDVMTGIPSIVAGLFAFALFAIFFGPGIRFGIGGAVALSILMIPVVVRSTEEMLKLVPNELREASYALGVPKWLTIVKIVIPTAIGGIITGVMLSISRIIGETAPLLIIVGMSTSMNYNLFSDRMATLPVFVYTQYASQGSDAQAYIDRAWTGALVLILIVMALNLIARLVSKLLAPKGLR
ncbi:phosphate transport system permease protein [Aurantimicrobium minutum]|uniref:phosphate ABC transporter permease PstA n=1 Tax=Aurantimicrobium minutum TaxID=708131 RepID=UPI00247E65AD|nr:phosphate transport system permease protein [Aurantimicrobium minutum]